MPILTDTRAALTTAMFPPLGLAVAIVMAYSPPLPDWAMPAEPVVVEQGPRIAASYLQLDEPIHVGLKDGRVQLSLNLAFSARLPTLDLLTISEAVKKKQETLMAAITADVLARGEAEPETAKMLLKLRAELPASILEIANKELGTEELPTPVENVYVLDVVATAG